MTRASGAIDSFVTPEEFLGVILDFERYAAFLPEIERVEVHERGEGEASATFHVGVSVGGFKVSTHYRLRYRWEGLEVTWSLESSPELTRHEGRWVLEARDGETVARLEGEIESRLPIPAEAQEMFAREQTPKLLEAFRDRAEGL